MSDSNNIDASTNEHLAISKEYLYEQFKLFNSSVLRSIYGMKSDDIASIDTSNIEVGQVIQYTGETNATYTNSFFYRWDGTEWSLVNMGSSSMSFKAPLYNDGSKVSLNLDYSDPNALTGELISMDSSDETSLTDSINRIDDKTGSDIKFSDTNNNSIEQVVSSINEKTGSDINVSDTETTSIADAIEQLREPKVFFSLTDLGLTAEATVDDVRNALSGGEIFLAPVTLFNDYQSKFPYDGSIDQYASLLIIKSIDGTRDYIRWTNKLGTKEGTVELNSSNNVARWTLNRIANDGYTNDGSIVLSTRSNDITGDGNTPEALGLDSDVMKWPNGTYRLSHLPNLITNTPTTINGPATQGRLEHYNLKCWSGDHNPWSNTYGTRLSVWYDMDGRIYTRYQESGSKSGNQILADNETNGTSNEPLLKDTGWRAIQTTYTDLGQMGLSTGCTVVDICNRLLKLCSNSNNLTVPGSAVLFNYNNNISGLPSNYGILEVHYYHIDGIVIRYSTVRNSDVYIGKFTANVSSASTYEILTVTFDRILTSVMESNATTYIASVNNGAILNTSSKSNSAFNPVISMKSPSGGAIGMASYYSNSDDKFTLYYLDSNAVSSGSNSVSDEVLVNFTDNYIQWNGGIKVGNSIHKTNSNGVNYGLNLNGSDIVSVNGIYTEDESNNWDEGINYVDANNWDSLIAYKGQLLYNSYRPLNDMSINADKNYVSLYKTAYADSSGSFDSTKPYYKLATFNINTSRTTKGTLHQSIFTTFTVKISDSHTKRKIEFKFQLVYRTGDNDIAINKMYVIPQMQGAPIDTYDDSVTGNLDINEYVYIEYKLVTSSTSGQGEYTFNVWVKLRYNWQIARLITEPTIGPGMTNIDSSNELWTVYNTSGVGVASNKTSGYTGYKLDYTSFYRGLMYRYPSRIGVDVMSVAKQSIVCINSRYFRIYVDSNTAYLNFKLVIQHNEVNPPTVIDGTVGNKDTIDASLTVLSGLVPKTVSTSTNYINIDMGVTMYGTHILTWNSVYTNDEIRLYATSSLTGSV